MTYTTGEKPGVGTYTCTNCGQQVSRDVSELLRRLCDKRHKGLEANCVQV